MPALLWLLACAALALCARGETITNSHSGATATVTWTYDHENGEIDWVFTYTTPGSGGWSAGGWAYSTTGEGGPMGSAFFDLSPISSGSSSGSFPVDAGDWIRFGARVSGPGSWWLINPDVEDWYQVPVVAKKVRIAYHNPNDVPVRVKLVDAANPETVLADTVVQPGTGFIQTYTLPEGVNDVQLLTFVEGFERDGPSWVVSEGAVTKIGESDPLPGATSTGSEEPEAVTVPPPPGAPGAIKPVSDNPPAKPRPTVWFGGGGGSDLDATVFREGIDKLEVAIKELSVVPEGVDAPGTDEIGDTEPMEYVGAAQKIPAELPTFLTGEFGSTNALSVTLPGFSVGGVEWAERVWTFDASQYSTFITLMRALLLAVVLVCWFLLCVRTVRGASANE